MERLLVLLEGEPWCWWWCWSSIREGTLERTGRVPPGAIDTCLVAEISIGSFDTEIRF